MKQIELLAPAGDPEKLRIAIAYGADAVYVGGEAFGLRASAGNFDPEQLKEASAFVHKSGKRIYLTLNVFAHNEDIDGISAYIDAISHIPMDGYIVSDPGVIHLIRKRMPEATLHLSTQSNTTNHMSVAFWKQAGIRRIVLARELSLNEIREIREKSGDDVELEAFVHGAMCISYSGRCLLSNAMTGRDANQGECTHPCRWKYQLVEEQRPGEFYPIEENERGAYIMNAKDLCMIEHIPDLIRSGLDSLKIEGRSKSLYYVASVVGAYRKAIDAYYSSPETYRVEESWLQDLNRASHRLYSTGFFYGRPDEGGQNYETSQYVRESTFLGLVKDYDPVTRTALIQQRNKIVTGDTIEVFGPGDVSFVQQVEGMTDVEGNLLVAAPHPKQMIRLPLAEPAYENFIVCKKN
ncbi:MAG: peptidase U32 [Firmicutes bacterium HGW-Firmicutes-11]|jgi:putative protease|nr:MAG: peptidase U32 [Firmicutes bacterium HGW-Firmicutes-11]